MSVITEDGSFFTFNVKYAKEPDMLNIEMKDFIHDGSAVNRPNRSTFGRLQGKNSMDIYLKELGSESPVLVRLVMKSIWKQNERIVKHIGGKGFGIRFLLKGIYTHNGLLYFHTEIKNTSNVPFDVDYIIWKIVVCVAGRQPHVRVYGYPAGLNDHRTKMSVATEDLLSVGFVRTAVVAGRNESHCMGKCPFVGEPVHVPNLSQYAHGYMLANAGDCHEQFKAMFVPFRLA